MSARFRKTAFWVLLLLFALSGLWWVLSVPYRPDAVFSAIPSNATFVTVHRNLDQELNVMASHPVMRSALISAGVRDQDLTSVCSNRETQAWIHRLASRETVFAYVPELGYQRKPAWVFASWIGGESQRLRWHLRWFKSADLRPIRLDYGRTIWITRTKFSQPGQRLSLALSEGMVLGCVSSDPAGVRWLIETGDGHPTRPSVLTSGELASARALAPTNLPHWGWYSLASGGDATRFSPNLIGLGVTFLPDGRLDLSLVGNQALPAASALSTQPDYRKMASFLGSAPDLVTVMPLSWSRPVLLQTATPLWAEAVSQLTDTHEAPTNALAFLALLNREHSGRIRGALGKSVAALVGKGLRVPTLVIGVQVRDANEGSARINRMVEVLNSRYGWSLAARTVESAGRPITLIAETRNNVYGKFEPDEQVAYTMLDNWLILASNAAMLQRLLNRPPQTGEETWARPSASDASASAWVDLNRCGKTLKEALAATQLAMMVGGSEGSTTTGTTLDAAREWIERVQVLEQATASMTTTGAVSKMSVIIGR
jgi:hypothetical protein